MSDDARIGDKVIIDGLVTLMRQGAWRKTKIMEASGTLTKPASNGFWEVQIPDLGLCLVHRTAMTFPRMIATQPWGTLVVSPNRHSESGLA